MLNSDTPLTQLLPLSNVPQQSRRQSDPATVFSAHTSDQNASINQPKKMYQPWI
ncbi:hypothetical protein HDV63DRAFT_370528, partial [Trichoderma sp. SZMC 28014]